MSLRVAFRKGMDRPLTSPRAHCCWCPSCFCPWMVSSCGLWPQGCIRTPGGTPTGARPVQCLDLAPELSLPVLSRFFPAENSESSSMSK